MSVTAIRLEMDTEQMQKISVCRIRTWESWNRIFR